MAPKIAARAGIVGSTFDATEIEIAIGTTIAALAVFDVVSEMITAISTDTAVMPIRLETPRLFEIDSPIVAASSVSARRSRR